MSIHLRTRKGQAQQQDATRAKKPTTCNYHTYMYICPWESFAQCIIIRIEKMTTFLLLANAAVGDSKQHIYSRIFFALFNIFGLVHIASNILTMACIILNQTFNLSTKKRKFLAELNYLAW